MGQIQLMYNTASSEQELGSIKATRNQQEWATLKLLKLDKNAWNLVSPNSSVWLRTS